VWQRIVKVKIRGQAQCLKSLGCPNVDTLLSLSGGVLSGDPENIEAQAARIYWKSLFGKVFRRLAFSSEDSDRINSALNYGYAIARSIVARSLVSHGFVPSIGIHHDNQLNAYNLADDLLELLRPLIDHTVFELSRVWDNDNPDLTTMDKQALARVCDMQVLVNNEKHSLLWGVDLVVQSLMVAGKSKNPKEFVPMQLLF
jgi:CRISPR-associated protein Cas1